jgi:ERCC4-type nuclease
MHNANPLTFDLNGVRVRREAHGHGGLQAAPTFQPMAVCPFTVVVDSREQLPYEFLGMVGPAGEALVVPTKVKGLASGDYSIEGMGDRIAIERKSLDDLFGIDLLDAPR